MNTQLAIHGGTPVIDSKDARFIWPKITKKTKEILLEQLDNTISIYDNSGIFGEFERTFANYHGMKYGLLFNSGTSAILSMFEAIGLKSDDEVLCPVYTFHATVSPMMYLGVIPVFCDCDKNGNICISDIKNKITERTKAVIVTHMWGIPVADIKEIANFCKKNNLFLLEDCSHAHGAEIYGQKVGSFGDVSAWSLQGQKIITGGEGGILVTNNKQIYDRSLLLGHYNKRPKQEISKDNFLREYYLTGMGLKLRAHPLAIAIANEQFEHLDDFLQIKRYYFDKISKALKKYPFLKTPQLSSTSKPSGYAYGLQFLSENSFGITKQQFVDALLEEGLSEVDVPGSTGLLNKLPLFCTPNKILNRLYKQPLKLQTGFPNAELFYERFIKLPLWAFKEDENIMDAYIEGIMKVSDYVLENKSLLKDIK